MIRMTTNIERRLLWLTAGLAAGGSLIVWACFGTREGLSFAGGALVGGGDLLWLRATVGRLFGPDLTRSKAPVLAGYFLRLLLIPLGLYVMIRFLFVELIAAVAGLVVLICSVLVEGILEAFVCNPR